MRVFPFITVGQILEEIWNKYQDRLPEEKLWRETTFGDRVKRYPITRATFYRKEKELDFPGKPTEKNQEQKKWRKYSREEANEIIRKLEEDSKYFGASMQ